MTPSATHTGELELVTCPLCGSDQFEALFRARDLLYGVPGEFQIVRCKPCAHTYLNPRPTRDAIGDLYPNNYRPHHAHRTSQNGMEEAGAEGGGKAMVSYKSPAQHPRPASALSLADRDPRKLHPSH